MSSTLTSPESTKIAHDVVHVLSKLGCDISVSDLRSQVQLVYKALHTVIENSNASENTRVLVRRVGRVPGDHGFNIDNVQRLITLVTSETTVSKDLLDILAAYQQYLIPHLQTLETRIQLMPHVPQLSAACVEMIELSEQMADAMTWATDGSPRILGTPFPEFIRELQRRSSEYSHKYYAGILSSAQNFEKQHDTAALLQELVQVQATAQALAPDLECSFLVALHKDDTTREQPFKFQWRVPRSFNM